MSDDLKQTLFRLSKTAREFLEQKGEGNMTKGLQLLIEEASQKTLGPALTNKDKKPIVRRESSFQKEEYKYLLIRDSKAMASLSFPFKVQREMIEKYGDSYFYEQIVIKGLVGNPEFAPYEESISEIKDLDTAKLVYRREKNDLLKVYIRLAEISDAIVRDLESDISGKSSLDKKEIADYKNYIVKVAKDHEVLRDEVESIVSNLELIELSYKSGFPADLKAIILGLWKQKKVLFQDKGKALKRNREVDNL